MTKWITFFIYTVFLVLSMRWGAVWLWLIIMPTFLLLMMWAEEDQDWVDTRGPAARDTHIE